MDAPRIRLIIGDRNYSSWSLRAWLGLRATGAPFDEVLVPLDAPGTRARLRALSPTGKVPVMVDGPVVVWESLAILERLAERFPEAGLWPSDPAERAEARSLSAEMHAGFPELRASLPMNLRLSLPGPPLAGPALMDEARRVAAIWRGRRADPRARARGPFLFGAFGAVDAMFAPVAARLLSYGVPLDGPCAEYAEAIRSHPHFAEWSAAARADPRAIPAEDLVEMRLDGDAPGG